MRIIINFIVIGLIYYAIYLYFPDFFAQIVTIAQKLFSYVHDGFNAIVNWAHQPLSNAPATTPTPPTGQ